MEPRLFYDGGCALCHRAVRFAVRHDRGRPPVRFSPIGGESFERMLTAAGRPELPDSLLLLAPDGELLMRSAYFSHNVVQRRRLSYTTRSSTIIAA